MTDETANETKFYFGMLQELNRAKQVGDAAATWEALDELNVFTLHASPSPLRSAAAVIVARHRFHRAADSLA